VRQHQERGGAHRQEPEPEGPLGLEGGGRDQHRRQEQHREGVLQPAGQVEQGCELEDVEGEQEGGGVVAEPVAGRELDPQQKVDPDRGGDHQEAEAEGEREAQPESHARHGGRLAGDRQPAQPHQRVEAQLPGMAREIRRSDLNHDKTG
jgi:hypothetical protein